MKKLTLVVFALVVLSLIISACGQQPTTPVVVTVVQTVLIPVTPVPTGTATSTATSAKTCSPYANGDGYSWKYQWSWPTDLSRPIYAVDSSIDVLWGRVWVIKMTDLSGIEVVEVLPDGETLFYEGELWDCGPIGWMSSAEIEDFMEQIR